MLIGGYDPDSVNNHDEVELISLDPENHPVPECLRVRNRFRDDQRDPPGAALVDGKVTR